LFDFCCFVFFFFELIDDLVFVLFIFLFRLIEVFNYCVDFVCEFILYYFEREIKFFYFSYIGFAFELNVDVISRVYDLFPFLFNYTDRFVCTRYFSLVEFFTCDLLPFFFPTFPWFWGFLSSFNRSLIVQISTYHDLYLNRLSYIFFDQPFYFEFCKQAWTNLSLDLEIVWTIVPTLILVFIAIPSFWVLFCVDELLDPLVTVKCIGNQWYWSYEYDHYGIRFDSYMLPLEDQFRGGLRLLEVDNYLVLPINVSQRILVTSTDVIHSWAVPAFGIKVDGVPGRLNQLSFYGTRCGLFFGQCSELCGVNHGFMPIAVRLVSVNEFIDYVRLRGYDLLSL
jgi:cytochrome c oxidase subunit 2